LTYAGVARRLFERKEKMRITILFCLFLVLVIALPCVAQEKAPEEEGGGKRMRDAGASGMAYGSIMIALVIVIALPSLVLMLITKAVSIEEVGFLKCVYTSLIYFAAIALVFYSAVELESGLANPLEFFKVNNLLVRLGIVYVISLLLVRFFLAATLVKSLIGGLLYVVAVYGATFLAYKLIVAAGAQQVLRSGLTG
jgi:cytochrome c biogenesis factor